MSPLIEEMHKHLVMSYFCHTSTQWMAKVPNAVEILPKIWTAWVGRANVTDVRSCHVHWAAPFRPRLPCSYLVKSRPQRGCLPATSSPPDSALTR